MNNAETTAVPAAGLDHLAQAAVDMPDHHKLGGDGATHPPRILILYGSLRPESYSRKLALEAERLLRHFGAETRVFDPRDLPLLDSTAPTTPRCGSCANGPSGRKVTCG